ncbi:MAG: hypothetical protein K8R18_13200 [Parvibaculum sp.]|uniref:hypothetical protein n=1 Tax=Parvibaculum sp. TaxID=2024848 RepID=UPI0025DCAF80|nr:hypothetical protein [Parvibaculum sp.]MCE9650573.1 hypothetical protein [Parvibaculum sp.]
MPNIRFVRICALLALSLGACARVDIKNVPQANLGDAYVADTSLQHATIKGSGDTSGTMLSPTMIAYLVSIDGKNTKGRSTIFDPVQVDPGIHSLLVAYRSIGGTSHGFVPLMLDAKPGAAYVVREEFQGGFLRLGTAEDVTNHYMYIEDGKTGLAATDKVTDTLRRNTNMYTQSTDKNAATLRGIKMEKLLGSNACFIASVDGRFMPTVEGQTFLDHDRSDFDAVAKITPGRHAVAIGVDFGNIKGAHPFLLDAAPNTSYVVKCDLVDRQIDGKLNASINIVVENETAHTVVVPAIDLPIEF